MVSNYSQHTYFIHPAQAFRVLLNNTEKHDNFTAMYMQVKIYTAPWYSGLNPKTL